MSALRKKIKNRKIKTRILIAFQGLSGEWCFNRSRCPLVVVTVSVTVRGGDSVSEGDGLSCLSIADARRCLGGSKKIRVV